MITANAGELLRAVRRGHKLSQEDLAIRAGVPPEVISAIESGHVSPEVESLRQLLELLGEDLVLGSAGRATGIDITLNPGNLRLSPEQRVQRGLEFANVVRENRVSGAEGLGRSLQPGPLLQALETLGVEFVVVGSVAGLFYGSAYPTFDLDVACAKEQKNLSSLDSALKDLGLSCGIQRFVTRTVVSFETRFGSTSSSPTSCATGKKTTLRVSQRRRPA